MAEAILLSVFGMLASPVISKLVTDIMSNPETDNTNDLAEDLKDLKTTILPQLELTILAVKHRPPDKIAQLKEWLVNLKNAYNDAVHILHDVKCCIDKQPALLSLRGDNKKKKLLKRQLKRLKKVAAETKTFRELLGKASYNHPITSGNCTNRVFGREGDRNEIIKFLLDGQGGSSSSEKYSVVVVTGIEGAGKTMLAQYVFNDEKVVKYFDVRMWLSLSENLDITKLTKHMIECILGECPNISSLQVLQNKLKAKLPESGKIMIVLDDVWYDVHAAEQQWSGLLAPFASWKGTCKIVATSRSPLMLPRNLRGKYIELGDLKLADFRSFLRYRAIDDLQVDNPQLNDLSNIVNQIAEKMSKLSIQPLEAEVIGNELYHQRNITFWKEIQEVVNQFENFVNLFRLV